MKYVVSWTLRPGLSEEAGERLLAVFSKWSPTTDILQFVGRVDGNGGFAIQETDDPEAILRDVSPFLPWLDTQVFPVVDIQDTARVLAEANEFRASVS